MTVAAPAGPGFPRLTRHQALSLGDPIEVLKPGLGTVAGVGVRFDGDDFARAEFAGGASAAPSGGR